MLISDQKFKNGRGAIFGAAGLVAGVTLGLMVGINLVFAYLHI